MERRIVLSSAAFILCLVMVGNALATERYPIRPVTTTIVFAPGGIADLTVRLWNKYLEKYLGGNFLVDYRPGGGGVIGYTYVANARPDGYSLGNFPDFFLLILNKTATYKLDDILVVAQVVLNGSILAVSADAPWKTFDEFIGYCRGNPGVKWGHQGTGTMLYFRTENLSRQARLRLTGVPLKGDSDIIAALLGKHVAVGSLSAASARAQAQAGKLRILFFLSILPGNSGSTLLSRTWRLTSSTASSTSMFRSI